MSETYPSDAQLELLSGASDAEQGVYYIPTGQSPYYLSFYKMLHRLLSVARRAGDLRVYKDASGALKFGVRAGRFFNGQTLVTYAGGGGDSAGSLVNNAVNYIYLTTAGVLTVNQSGFPNPLTTPHLPLATITTAAGEYGIEDIADCRGGAIFRPVAGATPPAASQTITDDGFTLNHNHSPTLALTVNAMTAGSSAVTAIADGSVVGQRLVIVWTAGDCTQLTIKDGANTKLRGDFVTASRESSLAVVWDGADWIEEARNTAASDCVAGGLSAVAGGVNCTASGGCAHAEGANCVASGDQAHAEGTGSTASAFSSHAQGEATQATGAAAHAEGEFCIASGEAGHAQGVGAVAGLYAQHAQAGGMFGAAGDAQFTRFVLHGATANATPTELAGPARFTLADEKAYLCQVLIVARQDTGANHVAYVRRCLIHRTGGAVALVAAAQTLGADVETDVDWDVALAADDVNKSLKITVTGKAATNIHWVAVVEAVEVGFAD